MLQFPPQIPEQVPFKDLLLQFPPQVPEQVPFKDLLLEFPPQIPEQVPFRDLLLEILPQLAKQVPFEDLLYVPTHYISVLTTLPGTLHSHCQEPSLTTRLSALHSHTA